jgi:hypothetical protein
VEPITEGRFNALAGYARQPMARIMAREIEFYQVDGGRIVGMIIEDRADRDFGGTVFGRDANERYRCVRVTDFGQTLDAARESLRTEMEIARQAPPEDFYQGDETGQAVDFFTPVYEDTKLNPSFLKLVKEETLSPAFGIIEPMMRWHQDIDGNFVEQFQTNGFDQRIWELYLFAVFNELGFEIDTSVNVPDFVAHSIFGSLAVEAATVGPTQKGGKIVPPPSIEREEDRLEYLRNYMPIKFGSALYSKMKKRYWEAEHILNLPFLIAVHDFSSPRSMVHTRSALEHYVFGYTHEFERHADGLKILPKRIGEHRWGEKVIPSGFFELPDAQHVAGILFSNSGTVSKFNRMGILNGFGSGRVMSIREGTMVNHDPNATLPKYFRVLVNAEGYEESWVEGLSVLHNPHALHPLDPDLIPGAAHLFLQEDGNVVSHTPDFFPFGSVTNNFASVDVDEVRRKAGDATHIVWTPREDEGPHQ